MAPTTIPPSSFPSSSFPGQHAAATITISSDSVVPVVAPTVVVLSSSCSGAVVVNISSSDDDDDATSRPTLALRRQCRPSPPPAPVRPPAVVTGDEAPRRRRRAATRRPRRAASPPASTAQQQQPKKRIYEKWSLEDDREVLTAMADLRAKCKGVRAPASEVLRKLKLRGKEGAFSRPDLPVKKLSDKIRRLKKQFKAVHEAGGIYNPRTKYCDGELYEISKNVWPEQFKR